MASWKDNLQPEFLRCAEAFIADAARNGFSIAVTSAYRSPAKQAALYANRANNPNVVAAPGTSPHEKGIAIDVNVNAKSQANTPQAVWQQLAVIAGRNGLWWHGMRDPVHFQLLSSVKNPSSNGFNTQTNNSVTPPPNPNAPNYLPYVLLGLVGIIFVVATRD